jgi:hypothetical protein
MSVSLKKSEAPGAPVIEQVELYKDSYALIIGNDAYNNGWPPLGNAVKDAELIASELEQKGFSVELHKDLTSAELNTVFKRFFILKGDNPDARLFIWYAGHGATVDGEGYLIPVDAPVPSAGGAFKSCFAGTVFSAQRNMPPSAITHATTLPVRQFLTSGDADQTVSDDGSFRELFIRAIRGEERADSNIDGYLTASELGLFLGDRITNLTQSFQTPRYGKLRDKDFDRGDFVFKLPKTARVIPAAPVPVSPDEHVVQSGNAAEIAFWKSIEDSESLSQFEAYLTAYPEGIFASLAKLKKQEQQQKSAKRTQPTNSDFKVSFKNQNHIAVKTANIRVKPFDGSARVGRLSKGDEVWAVGESRTRDGTWYLVARDGAELGFVFAALLEDQVAEITPELSKQSPVVAFRSSALDTTVEVGDKNSLTGNKLNEFVSKNKTEEPDDTDRWSSLVRGIEAELESRDQQVLVVGEKTQVAEEKVQGVEERKINFVEHSIEDTTSSRGGEVTAGTILEAPEASKTIKSKSQQPSKSKDNRLIAYTIAAQEGDVRAQAALGYIYDVGIDTDVNPTKAQYWYEKAASQGNLQAQKNLAIFLASGERVPADLRASAHWFTQAAQQGDAEAQQTIGYYYEVGKGVKRDYTQAVKWYTRAAQQGQVDAQHNLARLYQLGLGSAIDMNQAIYWYEKAASQGDEDSRLVLSSLANKSP